MCHFWETIKVNLPTLGHNPSVPMDTGTSPLDKGDKKNKKYEKEK